MHFPQSTGINYRWSRLLCWIASMPVEIINFRTFETLRSLHWHKTYRDSPYVLTSSIARVSTLLKDIAVRTFHLWNIIDDLISPCYHVMLYILWNLARHICISWSVVMGCLDNWLVTRSRTILLMASYLKYQNFIHTAIWNFASPISDRLTQIPAILGIRIESRTKAFAHFSIAVGHVHDAGVVGYVEIFFIVTALQNKELGVHSSYLLSFL